MNAALFTAAASVCRAGIGLIPGFGCGADFPDCVSPVAQAVELVVAPRSGGGSVNDGAGVLVDEFDRPAGETVLGGLIPGPICVLIMELVALDEAVDVKADRASKVLHVRGDFQGGAALGMHRAESWTSGVDAQLRQVDSRLGKEEGLHFIHAGLQRRTRGLIRTPGGYGKSGGVHCGNAFVR